jgi:hypothetical protein
MVLLTACRTLGAPDLPAVYRCDAVSLSQVKNGRTYSRAFMVKSMHISIDRNRIRIFGVQSGKHLCRSLDIERIWADTLFLADPGVKVRHSALKFYFSDDTIISNVNFFESDTSVVTVKALVKRLTGKAAAAVNDQCR